LAPRILDGGAGFSDAAHAGDGVAFDEGGAGGGEARAEVGEEFFAAFEEGA
jgi:hypothetical protein